MAVNLIDKISDLPLQDNEKFLLRELIIIQDFSNKVPYQTLWEMFDLPFNAVKRALASLHKKGIITVDHCTYGKFHAQVNSKNVGLLKRYTRKNSIQINEWILIPSDHKAA